MSAVIFYLFATFLVISGVMVVLSRNPVHSVLFLILAFFNAAALFIFLNAEFLAMVLVIVYVGAVAVLFLFVVMMLDVRSSKMKGLFLWSNFKSWLKNVGAVILYSLIFFVNSAVFLYGLSVALSYILILAVHTVLPYGAIVNLGSFEHFVEQLRALDDSDVLSVLLSTHGFPLPKAFDLLSGGISISSILSFFLMVLSLWGGHGIATYVTSRLFDWRMQGLLLSPPIIIILSGGFFGLLVYTVNAWQSSSIAQSLLLEPMPHKQNVTNTEALGMILYTHYALVFQLAGVLLLIAMIGAIVLTLRKRDGAKRQHIGEQLARSKDNSLELKKVPLGEGVSI